MNRFQTAADRSDDDRPPDGLPAHGPRRLVRLSQHVEQHDQRLATADVLKRRLRSSRDQRAAHLQRPIVGRDQKKVEISGLQDESDNILLKVISAKIRSRQSECLHWTNTLSVYKSDGDFKH